MSIDLLVPLDASPFAEAAIPLASRLARDIPARLHLIHIVEPLGEADPRRETEDEEYPRLLAQEIGAEIGVETISVRREGTVIDELRDYIEEAGIDLIIIATHGWGGLRKLWLGSIPEELIKGPEAPVITVRPGHAPISDAPLRHILLPLDRSELSESIFTQISVISGPETRLSLLHTVPGPVPNDPASISYALTTDSEELEDEQAEGLAYLERLADAFIDRVGRIDTIVVTEPEITESILDYADENDVDLIAITTHGRGGLSRSSIGSVADELLRTAQIPVLVFRPPNP